MGHGEPRIGLLAIFLRSHLNILLLDVSYSCDKSSQTEF